MDKPRTRKFHVESGMISFFGLCLFIYCPSPFEVDFSQFFPRRAKSNFPQVVHLSRTEIIKVEVESDYTLGRVIVRVS